MRNFCKVFYVLILVAFLFRLGYSNSDSLVINTLSYDLNKALGKIDSLESQNQKFEVKLSQIDAKNDGRNDLLKVFIPVMVTIFLFLLGYNVVRSKSAAQAEAREAFRESFDDQFKKIETCVIDAEKKLGEINNIYKTLNEMGDSKKVSSGVDLIYEKNRKKSE